MIAIPRRTCGSCGEYLPHYCTATVAYSPAAQVERLALRMCMPCWEDACQDCQRGGCLCACNDAPPVRLRLIHGRAS